VLVIGFDPAKNFPLPNFSRYKNCGKGKFFVGCGYNLGCCYGLSYSFRPLFLWLYPVAEQEV